MNETTTIARTPRAAQGPNTDVLFQPYRLGPFNLRHRIVMAPLTRSRARQPGNVPSSLAACYYAQRASAALIVSEATQVSMQGQGYAWTPGIHSREQVEAWHRVTQAVHQADGLIFNQLWHVGRISHPALQPDNMLPVAPSAIIPEGKAFIENERGEGELVPFVRPRALNIEEMPYIVAQYERAASKRPGRRFRRRRDPRRQRLSARSVHRDRHQPAHRHLWRPGREPDAIVVRGRRGLDADLGAGSHRRAAVADGQDERHPRRPTGSNLWLYRRDSLLSSAGACVTAPAKPALTTPGLERS